VPLSHAQFAAPAVPPHLAFFSTTQNHYPLPIRIYFFCFSTPPPGAASISPPKHFSIVCCWVGIGLLKACPFLPRLSNFTLLIVHFVQLGSAPADAPQSPSPVIHLHFSLPSCFRSHYTRMTHCFSLALPSFFFSPFPLFLDSRSLVF